MTRKTCLAIHTNETIIFALAALGIGYKTERDGIKTSLSQLTDENSAEVDGYICTWTAENKD